MNNNTQHRKNVSGSINTSGKDKGSYCLGDRSKGDHVLNFGDFICYLVKATGMT